MADKVNILVVEDDTVDQLAFNRLVRREDLPYQVTFAGTIHEAVNLLSTKTFDLAFVDHGLPDGSGLDVQPRAGSVPVIFLSAMADLTIAVKALKAGAYDYIIKDTAHEYISLLPAVVEKTLAQREFQRRIRMQQQIIENINEAVVLLDDGDKVVFANSTAAALFGENRETIIGKDWGMFIISDQSAGLSVANEGKREYDTCQVMKDGQKVWTAWSEKLLAEGEKICVGRDITRRREVELELELGKKQLEDKITERTLVLNQTNEILQREIDERKRIETVLTQSRDYYLTILEEFPLMIWQDDVSMNTIFYNRKLLSFTGKTREELTGDGWQQYIHPDDLVAYTEKYPVFFLERQRYEYEYRVRSSSGEFHWIIEFGTPLFDYDKQFSGFLGVCYDIHERKLSEAALRKSEEQYRFTLNNLPDLVLMHSNGSIVFANQMMIDCAGYAESELLNKSIYDLLLPELFDQVAVAIEHLAIGGKPDDRELGFLNASGHVVWTLARSVAFDQNGQKAILTVMRDITEQRNLQGALVKSQKLADIGVLTAGVAQDIKPPLQVLVGLSEAILKNLADRQIDSEQLTRQMESIHRNSKRISKIANSLLNYAQGASGEKGVHDLNAIVNDTLLLIEHQSTSRPDIRISTDLALTSLYLYCEHNRITQLLINLITNARDAMSTGGEINIRTGSIPQNDEIVLIVSDHGKGIPEPLQDEIFEPFFTTKPGEGTGLGLSIVREIVSAHGGRIELNSKVGFGTIFHIFFPAALPEGYTLLPSQK